MQPSCEEIRAPPGAQGVTLLGERAIARQLDDLPQRGLVRQPLEEVARRRGVGIEVVGHAVPEPELHRIEPELARHAIDHPLHDREGDGMANGPVLAHGRLVLKDDPEGGVVVPKSVNARQQANDVVALHDAAARVDGEGADAGQVVDPHAQDGAVPFHRDLGPDAMVARVDVALERLQAVGEELHRPCQEDRERARRDLVGVDVELDAEAPPHVPRDDADVALGDAEVAGQDVLHDVRRLRRLVHGEPTLRGVPVRDGDPGLEGNAGVAREDERVGVDGVGLGEGSLDVARAQLGLEHQVVPELGMDDRRAGIEGGLGIDHGG